MELEQRCRAAVRARLDLQVDHAAERPPELGRVGRRLHLELVERVDAREDYDGLEPGLVVVHAVEHEVVVARPLAVGRERRRRAPRQAAGAVDVRAGNAAEHARDGPRQVDEVAAVQRQRLDLLVGHRRAELRRGCLQQRRLALTVIVSLIAPISSLRSMRARWSTPSSMFESASVLNPADLCHHGVAPGRQRRGGVLPASGRRCMVRVRPVPSFTTVTLRPDRRRLAVRHGPEDRPADRLAKGGDRESIRPRGLPGPAETA